MKNKDEIKYSLSLNNSLLLKGIAICFLLSHHLFFNTPEYGSYIQQSALLCRVCVAMFVFISGYGLSTQYEKIKNNSLLNTIRFQAKRFTKFYINYWVIFIITVPLGVFIFGRSLQEAYESENIIRPLITDFLGLNGFQSYNETWWFNKLIIGLYIIFPFIYFLSKQWSWIALLLSFSFLFFADVIPVVFISFIGWYLFPFTLGVIYSSSNKQINKFFNSINRNVFFIALLFLFFIFCYIRQSNIIPQWSDARVDGVISLIIVIIVSFFKDKNIPFIKTGFEYLGKHSMNIFLIHTFICGYFFKDFIYSFYYPIIIFLVLLLTSLLTSIVIEYIKKIIRIPELISKINYIVNKI